MNSQKYLVFDIETNALPWDSFDATQQEYLLRGAQTEEEQEQKKHLFALSPLTSHIVCIGVAIAEMTPEDESPWNFIKQGVLSVNADFKDKTTSKGSLGDDTIISFSDEKTLLTQFWSLLNYYPQICLISFNGRGFDAPYLMLRSAVHKVKPSRNLMQGTRYNYRDHIDLADELSYYGFQQSGATRRYNFDFYARSFGITSPKSQGIDGSKVSEFFSEGKLQEIAEYCLRDVRATWELFLHWNTFLRI